MNLNIVRRDSNGQPFSSTAYVMAPSIPASADQRMPPTFLLFMTVMLSIPLAALGLVGICVYFLVRWVAKRSASRRNGQ
jgi:hypothetical protein